MLLNHVNISCNDADAMAEFFERLGCIYRGERPAFNHYGHWLYDDSGKPVVHLTQKVHTVRQGSIDHIAFNLTDVDTFRAHLKEEGLPFVEKPNELARITQIKLMAPEQVELEFQFPFIIPQ
ncbi:MAG: VOC family protein [Granulosicoccaceae bacterium]